MEKMNQFVQNEKSYFLTALKSNLEDFGKVNNEELEKLRRQISYLKGRINLADKGKVQKVELKVSKNKKSFFNSIIDSLAD